MLHRIIVSHFRLHGGGRIQIQSPVRRIDYVTNPITDDTATERHPAAPVPRNPKWRVRTKRHRPDPKIIVESLGNLMMLVHFGQVGDLAIDILESVAAGMNGVNLANGPGPNPLADTANGIAGMTLVAELGDNLVFVGRGHEFADFMDRMSQRLFAIHMLASPHRLH